METDWVDVSGVTLWGDCGEFALRPGWWQAMLGLARQYGWQPRGTRSPADYTGWTGDPATWDGRYWPGVGQQVTDEDAREFGAALAGARADIPDHDVLPRTGAEDADLSALELLSGPAAKEVLGWWLEHCARCGGFDICDFDYMALDP